MARPEYLTCDKTKNYLVHFIVAAMFLILCVRPAEADGTITVGVQDYWNGMGAIGGQQFTDCGAAIAAHLPAYRAQSSYEYCDMGDHKPSTMTGTFCTYDLGLQDCSAVLSNDFQVAQRMTGYICPANSFGSGGTCTCAAGYEPDTSGTACQEAAAATPQEQAEQAAYDAAIAAGKSPAAAQAASDAVATHYDEFQSDSQALIDIGATSANAYDSMIAEGMSPVHAGTVSTGAASNYAAARRQGVSHSAAFDIAESMANVEGMQYSLSVAQGQAMTTEQIVASVVAGGLAGGAMALAVAGAAPIATALAASAAVHAGMLAFTDLFSSPSDSQQQAAISGGSEAIRSGAQPLQVTLAPQVTAAAVTTTATEAEISAASKAAVTAMATVPESSWAVPAPTMPTNAATIAARTAATVVRDGGSAESAQAAAKAAAQTIVGGGTVAAAKVAGQAASDYVAAGGTTAGASVVGTQAGQSFDGATEGTLKGVKSGIDSLVSFGTGQTVNDDPTQYGRASSTAQAFNNSVNSVLDDIIGAEEGEEQSTLDAFVLTRRMPRAIHSPGRFWTRQSR